MEPAALFTKFEHAEEDWTGLSDQKKRKQLQNRINQRARSMWKIALSPVQLLSRSRNKDAASPIRSNSA